MNVFSARFSPHPNTKTALQDDTAGAVLREAPGCEEVPEPWLVLLEQRGAPSAPALLACG